MKINPTDRCHAHFTQIPLIIRLSLVFLIVFVQHKIPIRQSLEFSCYIQGI